MTSFNKNWTREEIETLYDMAGFASIGTIANATGHTQDTVEDMLAQLGISATLQVPELLWCVECGKTRSTLTKNGICRVCNLKHLTEKMNRRFDALYETAPPEIRVHFKINQQVASHYLPDSEINRRKARCKDVAADVLQEEYETVEAQKQYNAAKVRLSRIKKRMQNA